MTVPKTTVTHEQPTPRPEVIDTIAVVGGVFMMGNDGRKADEKPAHQVRLEGFRISPSPITNRQYFVFLEETGHARPKDPAFAKNYLLGYPDMPVINVSYDDAVAFCKWAAKNSVLQCGFRQRLNGNIRI